MPPVPESVAAFLTGRVLAVAGVSRDPREFSNAIVRKLRDAGHTVFPVNPHADTVEGFYGDPVSLPEVPHGILLCTPPSESAPVVRAALAAGVRHVWFHRSVGAGSVSDEAVAACREADIDPVVGGCPMMFVGPVDVFHRCMRWCLQRTGSVPR